MIAPDILLGSRIYTRGALMLKHSLPAIHQFRVCAAAGGLMSCGTLARLVSPGRHLCWPDLKGERPVDLPAQQWASVKLSST